MKTVTRALLASALLCSAVPPAPAAAADGDQRQLVTLPAAQRSHILADMREHLVVLNDILILVSGGEVEEAADTAQKSFGPDGPMASFPAQMGRAAADMREAGHHLSVVLRASRSMDADEALDEITTALQEVTAACVACHTAFRLK